MKKIIITIDGHSACGKSTLAKDLAGQLKYGYIDTGAMYRAVTFFFLENRVNIQKTAELERALTKINITFKNTVRGNRTFLNGKDVEDVIRKMFVSKNVSHVSAISAVRKVIVKQQQQMGKNKGIVMEGRDIGTVVFPKAELKLFLTADADTRTKRRYNELKNKGQNVSMKSVKANLMERDHIDSTRKDSPLKKAKEAIIIDNTNLTQKEQLAMALALAKERIRKLSEKHKTQTQTQTQTKSTSKKPKPTAQNKPRPQKKQPNTNSNSQKKESPKKSTPNQNSQRKNSQLPTQAKKTTKKSNPNSKENRQPAAVKNNNKKNTQPQQSKKNTNQKNTTSRNNAPKVEQQKSSAATQKNNRSKSSPNSQKKQSEKTSSNKKNSKPNPPNNRKTKTSSRKSRS